VTIESLRNDQRNPGRVIRAFKLPGQTGPRVEIIENIAPDTEPGTDEFVVNQDGKPEFVMGLRPSTTFGTYLGIAAVEKGEEVDPNVLQISAEALLAAEGINKALVPPEARDVGIDEMSSLFGSRDRTFGMYVVSAAAHEELTAA